jgi:hypothetical protein
MFLPNYLGITNIQQNPLNHISVGFKFLTNSIFFEFCIIVHYHNIYPCMMLFLILHLGGIYIYLPIMWIFVDLCGYLWI